MSPDRRRKGVFWDVFVDDQGALKVGVTKLQVEATFEEQ